MKDPICTRCGEIAGGHYWAYQTKIKTVYLCDNCCKNALLFFSAKGRIQPYEIAKYAERKMDDLLTM